MSAAPLSCNMAGVTFTMYGIKNCDTIKKARAWLDAHGHAYRFHDYKIEGIDRPRLERWCRERGWEAICNRAGTTFRKLSNADTRDLDPAKAVALMLAHPSAVKRPVLEIGDRLLVGFSPDAYAAALDEHAAGRTPTRQR